MHTFFNFYSSTQNHLLSNNTVNVTLVVVISVGSACEDVCLYVCSNDLTTFQVKLGGLEKERVYVFQ